MVHIVAYADENYLDDGFVFMGGYTAPVDTWIDFAGKWKSVLIEHPEVPYFSSRGFKSQKWQRKHGVVDAHLLPAKTLKLATLVARSGLWFPVVSTIEKSLFEKVIKSRVRATKNPRYELLRDPYYFVYVRLLGLLLQRIPELNSVLDVEQRMDKVDVFVDQNGKLAENAASLFMDIKRISDPDRQALMGVSAPLDDKDTMPLQCADLLIGQLREFYIGGTFTDACKTLLEAIRPPMTMCRLDWKKGDLERFAARLSELPPQHWLSVVSGGNTAGGP